MNAGHVAKAISRTSAGCHRRRIRVLLRTKFGRKVGLPNRRLTFVLTEGSNGPEPVLG
jgi:hypothetical protein